MENNEFDDVATVPDGMTMADLRRALAERLANQAAVPAHEVPPSFDITAELPVVQSCVD